MLKYGINLLCPRQSMILRALGGHGDHDSHTAPHVLTCTSLCAVSIDLLCPRQSMITQHSIRQVQGTCHCVAVGRLDAW